ncbi:hypothetical protein AMECASPLE_014142 [Ameca splendens]|uniref:Uncharacterized protein n=1 Tax=Ameca splendens TaxID=208324 RepID=A0ABV0XEM8_9TELE
MAPKDPDSWKTLLRAAEIRGHRPIPVLAKDLPEGSILSVLYHRKYYSIFTMKKELKRMQIQSKISADRSYTEDQSTQQDPVTSRVYEAKCIICVQCSKYLKGQKIKESLTKCRVRS